MTDFVKSFISNKVLHLELTRIEKKNSLNSEMYLAMTAILEDANNNPDVSVILFKGGQGCFCAGNDIADFLNENVIAPGSPIANFLHLLADIKKPMIAAVSGPAIGIGTTMLLHCDLVYATEKTIFSLPFVNLGVCAEAGSSYLLSRQIGHVRAAELLLFGEAFNAQKAKEYGIINAIIEDENYWQFAQTQAEQLAQKPYAALLANKKLMQADKDKIHQVIDEEIKAFSQLLKTPEAKAVFEKFLNR